MPGREGRGGGDSGGGDGGGGDGGGGGNYVLGIGHLVVMTVKGW